MKKKTKTTITEKSKNKSDSNPILQFAIIIIVFAVGVGVGFLINEPVEDKYELASEAKIQITSDNITNSYQEEFSVRCNDPTDPIKPNDRIEVFQKYLKVNQYANRAVIRGCNDVDYLLAKNSQGNWDLTGVNISLDLRANPKWQKECMIEDITTADDTVRPENNWIDEMNYEICKDLRNL